MVWRFRADLFDCSGSRRYLDRGRYHALRLCYTGGDVGYDRKTLECIIFAGSIDIVKQSPVEIGFGFAASRNVHAVALAKDCTFKARSDSSRCDLSAFVFLFRNVTDRNFSTHIGKSENIFRFGLNTAAEFCAYGRTG